MQAQVRPPQAPEKEVLFVLLRPQLRVRMPRVRCDVHRLNRCMQVLVLVF